MIEEDSRSATEAGRVTHSNSSSALATHIVDYDGLVGEDVVKFRRHDVGSGSGVDAFVPVTSVMGGREGVRSGRR